MDKRFIWPGTEEPTHPMQIRQLRDLIKIYTQIKSKYQTVIDAALDRASEQIGFVVNTSIPIRMEIANQGVVKNITIADETIKGTLFDTEMSKVTKKMSADKFTGVTAGNYNLELFWEDAVKMQLDNSSVMIDSVPLSEKTAAARMPGFQEPAHQPYIPWPIRPIRPRIGFMEPVHFLRAKLQALGVPELAEVSREMYIKKWPGTEEPIHINIDRPDISQVAGVVVTEGKILRMAIDKVYPELKLMETVSKINRYNAAVENLSVSAQRTLPVPTPPPVDPPQYFKQPVGVDVELERTKGILADLASVLKKYGY